MVPDLQTNTATIRITTVELSRWTSRPMTGRRHPDKIKLTQRPQTSYCFFFLSCDMIIIKEIFYPSACIPGVADSNTNRLFQMHTLLTVHIACFLSTIFFTFDTMSLWRKGKFVRSCFCMPAAHCYYKLTFLFLKLFNPFIGCCLYSSDCLFWTLAIFKREHVDLRTFWMVIYCY